MKEVKQIFDALNLRERLIVKLAVLASMRLGEIFGLKRERIDANSAEIEQRVYRGTVDAPKTQKSKRFAALSSGLRNHLEELLNRDPKVVADQQGHTLDVNLNVYTVTSFVPVRKDQSTI